MSGGRWHVAGPSDCVSSIADRYGHHWETVWNDAKNADLRKQRDNPNALLAGDRVWVPSLALRKERIATSRSHSFKRKGVPSRIRLRLLERGEPLANLPFRLEVDSKLVDGTTDGDGWMIASVSPQAQSALLVLGTAEEERHYQLDIGRLDPLDEISGIQHRLLNLGFPCPQTGELDEETREAIALFQLRAGVEASGKHDTDFLDRLRRAHDRGEMRGRE